MRLTDPTSWGEGPLTALTLAATASGLLFNLGYFSRAGVRFIPLFSLSEHLVFALTFALFALIAGLVALALFYVVVRPMIRRPMRRAEDRMRVRLTDYLPVIAVLVVLLAGAAAVLALNSMRGLDRVEWGFLGLMALAALVFLLLVRGGVERRTSFGAAAAAGMVLLSFLFGFFYAATSFWENGSRGATVAVLGDGTALPLARGGERYALLVDGETVVALPADNIARIERRVAVSAPD